MTTRRQTPLDKSTGTHALWQAVRVLMRPLVRLLLKKQVGYPSLSSLLRALFVEVAEQEFVLEKRRQTDSRISLLTGIHRKEVKRLRVEIAEDKPVSGTASLGGLLVSRWIADPDFIDPEGRPRPLRRTKGPDGLPSFQDLVSSVSKDIPAVSVLDEWLHLGIAEKDEQDRVKLRVDSFVAEHGIEEKFHFLGRNLRDHISASSHNVLGAAPPFLDRSVFYDNLSEESAETLAKIASEEGAELIKRINRRALELQVSDAQKEGATFRMTFGSYFYSVDEDIESGEMPVRERPDEK